MKDFFFKDCFSSVHFQGIFMVVALKLGTWEGKEIELYAMDFKTEVDKPLKCGTCKSSLATLTSNTTSEKVEWLSKCRCLNLHL